MDSDLNTILDVLQSARRRIVLDILSEHRRDKSGEETTVHVRNLARQVTAVKTGVDSPADGQSVHKTMIRLHHTDLPMLDEHGIIDYDQQLKTVSMTDQTAAVAQILHTIEDAVKTTDSDMNITPDLNH